MRKLKLCRLGAAALCLALLTGCGGGKRDAPIVDAPVDLRKTQELVLYIPKAAGEYTAPNKLMEEYRDFYSRVKLKVEYIPAESYGSRVAAELMAGGGPDIIFPSWLQDSDLYKMMDNGAFLNLDELMEQDGQFHRENYVEGVLEAARYRDQQYLMPLSYQTPFLMGSEEGLSQVGFRSESLTNIYALLKECTRITQNELSGGNSNYLSFLGSFFWANHPEVASYLLFQSDIRMMDYESKIPLPDEDSLVQWLSSAKAYNDIQRFSSEYDK